MQKLLLCVVALAACVAPCRGKEHEVGLIYSVGRQTQYLMPYQEGVACDLAKGSFERAWSSGACDFGSWREASWTVYKAGMSSVADWFPTFAATKTDRECRDAASNLSGQEEVLCGTAVCNFILAVSQRCNCGHLDCATDSVNSQVTSSNFESCGSFAQKACRYFDPLIRHECATYVTYPVTLPGHYRYAPTYDASKVPTSCFTNCRHAKPPSK